MRVLYIDVNCKNSSTGNIVYSLYSQCISKNIDAAVCYGRGKRIKENNIYKFGLDFETYLHAFLTRITGYTGCFSFLSTLRLIKYIKRFKPDIVHIHELHAYFVNISKLLKFLKTRNIKTIFTNHCEFIYTGKCGHAKECTKYSSTCGSCPHLRDYPSSLWFDKTSKMLKSKKQLFENWNNCLIVSPSCWLNSRMSRSFLKEKNRVVVHNGIDTSIFIVSKKQISTSDKKVILSVAPNIMSDLKGGKYVLELSKLFKASDVEFLLVGDTTNYSGVIPDNVKIYPLITDRKQLIELYQKANVFLICSSFENYPTTCLEAQCCGLPVFGFDVGGVSETILPGNGSVVGFADLNSLKEKIEKSLKEPIDKSIISHRSIIEFSNEKMFENYLEIYKTFV